MSTDCVYQLLGLKYPATLAEAKQAFRRLAQQVHPDRCKDPDAADRFRAIKAAHDFIVSGQPYTPDQAEVDPDRIPPGKKILSRQGWVLSSRTRI